MPTIVNMDLSRIKYTELGHDLPSVACQAAIELDNLILGRTNELPSVRELSARISAEVPEMSDLNSPVFVDLLTVVALHGTLKESRITIPSDEIGEFTRQAGVIASLLNRVSDDPRAARSSDLEELKKLKEFCLILSKQSAAASMNPDESRPPHPYRRQG